MTETRFGPLGDEKFVSLATFKRDGQPVATPMWVVEDGDGLCLWTPADAAKVKRVRRNPRVTLTPCGRTGKVRAGLPVAEGTAEVITHPGEVKRIESLLKRKYGFEYRIVTVIESLLSQGRKERVVVRVTPPRKPV
ncbi:PPOX class F420-dependent oxidoreductase [Mycobacterium sp. Marseille-P9652]|uniref:PPOX class F420-dependent oxidoreductase n=1 Tax=Mycobacterium sp. Marseille-P9652 TaxID=2654950 RepID=UPI0012E7CF06|nr:PPOX class F420-dependent oxidoreductase [Mycobacterium sp. Marseille-P9652]